MAKVSQYGVFRVISRTYGNAKTFIIAFRADDGIRMEIECRSLAHADLLARSMDGAVTDTRAVRG